ncbi:hypothetical protein Q361_11814 [Flavobacterium croceum DSM 17960]|uniref:Secreted protein with PEP-CTERM sorting signal n=1 Tax=Flavobacterium croceum DSM 17960 TaxID=1121886 RepID=A0A2S4N5B4_9FLAO|nr:hypothetical protein [Flavobacterium croceum]POS00881.1 hypothetical protein Q361_11814 [Flavobacterium croceum DSM 17960]
MKYNKMRELRKYVLGLLLVLGSITPAMADDTDNPDDPTSTDPGQAPIGDYAPVLVWGALAIGYTFLKRNQKVKGV